MRGRSELYFAVFYFVVMVGCAVLIGMHLQKNDPVAWCVDTVMEYQREAGAPETYIEAQTPTIVKHCEESWEAYKARD